jgi:multiple sugar transport system ATP-binding protein
MATVSIQKLAKHYKDIRAIENISLDIRDKEFLTVLGPSGCGKTTLLRLIAGLEVPSNGDILIDGKSVLEVPIRERDIAMVFQQYSLYNHMTIYDNLAFPLKMRKVSEQDIKRKVKDTTELLGLDKLLDRKPGKLSGGEQQRVALGRAIVREPKVFLMDEPLTFLDPKLRTQMRVEIKTLQRRLGVTTIYVTHDQAEAMIMSDRIALLKSGVLQQLGTPAEVYEKPINTFVASFLGSPAINLIDCSYVEKKGKTFLDLEFFKLDITDLNNIVSEERSGNELILGVRPEDIVLSREKSVDAIEAEVYVIEPLGSEINVIVKLPTYKAFKFGLHDVANVKTASGTDIKIGDKIWLKFNKHKIHIFNKSGESIL